MVYKQIYAALLLVMSVHYIHTSGCGVAILEQAHQGPHYQEQLIAYPERVKLEHLVCYLQKKQFLKAFQALQFLPPETFSKDADALLRRSIEGNHQAFIETVIPLVKKSITAEEFCSLLNWANNRYCNNSYEGLLNYWSSNLAPADALEIRFMQLVLSCYNGNTKRVKTELEWLSNSSRSINIPARNASIASRISYFQSTIHFKKEESHPTHSLIKSGHTLPLNAAVDSSEIDLMYLLLQQGANPSALDHEGESAEMLIARRLLTLDEDKRDLGSDEKLHELWRQERARAVQIVRILALYRENSYPDADKHSILGESEIIENNRSNSNSLRPDETLAYIHRRALYNKEIREEREARDALAAAQSNRALSLHLANFVHKLVTSGANLLFFSQ